MDDCPGAGRLSPHLSHDEGDPLIQRFIQSAARAGSVLALATALSGVAWAQAPRDLPPAHVQDLQQKLNSRLAGFPPIEGARTTGMAGLIEVRVRGQLFYVDPQGEYLIEGQMIETRTQRNLTEERLEEINKVDFASFPLKDAVVWKTGNGKRRLVVFSDPNCGYCKRLERTFSQLKDTTVYTFMIGILGDDSKAKSDAIWCNRDRTKAWRDWMVSDQAPPRIMGACSGTPQQRNLALAQRLRVNGTPAMFFEDGSRLPSAAPLDVIEQRLAKAAAQTGRN